MARDSQMSIVQQGVNEILEQAAQAAERGGPAAIRAMKIREDGELPPGRGVVISESYAAELSKLAEEKSRQSDEAAG